MSAERQAVLQDLGDNIDRLCTLDLRPPGPTSGYIGRFYQAVRALTDAPLTLTAAQCLHQITPQSTIVIATGFCHPERLPYGETDGPPGAAAQAAAHQLVAQVRPAALVVTEKVGPNRLGVAHSAMGFAIPDGARALIEYLLDAAHAAGLPTIGVGDNGNDVGFGLIEDVVRRYKPYGDVCQCPCGGGLATVTKVRTLVTAAVANWGAYGIVTCLAALRQQPDLLHSAATELEMLEACVRAGAADGITGRREATVDALPAAVHASIVELLHALIAKVT